VLLLPTLPRLQRRTTDTGESNWTEIEHNTTKLILINTYICSALNPYSQFRDIYTLDQVLKSPKVFGPLTKLQCCPTSDGAGCAIIASEKFVKEHGLLDQAVEVVAQEMATDSPKMLSSSAIEWAGADMTRRAAQELYKKAGITANDVQVIELHDCFSANEVLFDGIAH
jgi:sterol carrier protein 2